MKKIIKINSIILLLGIALIGFINKLNAAMSATVGFGGSSTAEVGTNITITLQVSNIRDVPSGVVAFGGNLIFDEEYLELVSSTGATTPYAFQMNKTGSEYIIAGLDNSMSSGIKANQTVFTFVFKPKKEGTTVINFTNPKLSDDNADKISTTVNSKSITIGPKTEKPPVVVKSGDADLKSLSASGYTLSPAFNKSTTSYTIKVPYDATTVKLEGAVNHSKASATGLGNITLTGDETTASIVVTAENGAKKTYTVNIQKEKKPEDPPVQLSGDATLKKLDVSGFTLTPTFKPTENTYSMKVKNNITGLNVDAIANDSKAKVEITGNLGWVEGVNKINIKVTAEDGTVNTYIVNVTREEETSLPKEEKKSNDNYLKSLIINNSHEITPKFSKGTSSYNVTVPYEIEKLNLSYLTNDSKAKVKVNGNSNFKIGEINIVEIEVTAEDGSSRFYTLNVTRSTKVSENDLKELSIKEGVLSPGFNKDKLEYTVSVPSNVDELTITAIPNTNGAKVEIIGNKNLKEGNNTVLIKVTDKNGFSKYYTLNVTKEKAKRIFGLTLMQFFIISSIIVLLLLSLLALLLFKRRKKESPNTTSNDGSVTNNTINPPVIEFKPEFNFGSKNRSDDDVVHGNLNQESLIGSKEEKPKLIATDASYEEVPYDPYDEVVTKDELVDAIVEAKKTKDPSKLSMLLEQEALNRKKEALRKKEESDNYDD